MDWNCEDCLTTLMPWQMSRFSFLFSILAVLDLHSCIGFLWLQREGATLRWSVQSYCSGSWVVRGRAAVLLGRTMRNPRGWGTLLGGCDWTEKMGLGVEEKKEDVDAGTWRQAAKSGNRKSKGKNIVFGLINDTFEKFLKAACFCITYIFVVVEEKW